MTTPISADDGQGAGDGGNGGHGNDGQGGGGGGAGGGKPAHKEPLPKFDTIFRYDRVLLEQGIAQDTETE
jgi:hypothetical protein